MALYTRKSTGTNEVHYLTRDHLGSVTAVTDASGAVETRLSYAAYGRRRNEASWSGNPSGGEWSGITNTTRHGYTGHEMLDNLDLTHMNSRVYAPRVGRFISADPYIDGALNTQGWNRYAYVKNNPLSAYDPSGFGQEDTGGDCNSSSEVQNPGDCSAGTTGGSGPSDTVEEVVVHSSRIGDGGGGSIETVTVSASRGGGLNPLPIDSNAGDGGAHIGGYSGGRVGGAPASTTQSEQKNKCSKSTGDGQSFAQRAAQNFNDVNKLPGLLAPTGTGLFTAGAMSQAWLGTKDMTFGRWALNGFRGITAGAATFTTTESAILVGVSAGLNFAVTGVSFEVGVAAGSVVSALPSPGDSDSLRDWLADKLMETLGPKLTIPEFECGW